MSDQFPHESIPVVRTFPTNNQPSKYDADDEQNVDDNASSDREIESPEDVLNTDVPILQTPRMRTPSKTNLNIDSNTHGNNLKVNYS